MLAAAPSGNEVVLTASPAVAAVVGAVLLIWLTLITVFVLRRCREPWRDDGRPVFRRLPDGRLRFSWGVATQLTTAQRQAVADHDADTVPLRLRATVSASPAGPRGRRGRVT